MDVIKKIAFLALISTNAVFGAEAHPEPVEGSSFSTTPTRHIPSLRDMCAKAAVLHSTREDMDAQLPPLVIQKDIRPALIKEIIAAISKIGIDIVTQNPNKDFLEDGYDDYGAAIFHPNDSMIYFRHQESYGQPYNIQTNQFRRGQWQIERASPKKHHEGKTIKIEDGKLILNDASTKTKTELISTVPDSELCKFWGGRRPVARERLFYTDCFFSPDGSVIIGQLEDGSEINVHPVWDAKSLHQIDIYTTDLAARLVTICSDGTLCCFLGMDESELRIMPGVLEEKLHQCSAHQLEFLKKALKEWKTKKPYYIFSEEELAIYSTLPVALKQDRSFNITKRNERAVSLEHLKHLARMHGFDLTPSASSSSSSSSASKTETRKRSTRPDKDDDNKSEEKETKQQCVRRTSKASDEEEEEWDVFADKGKGKAVEAEDDEIS